MYFLEVPAERHDIRNAWDLQEDSRDRPLQLRPRFRLGVSVAGHTKLVDLAEGRRLWCKLHTGARWQVGFGEALVHQHPRLEGVDVVVEREGDEGQPKQALAPHQNGAGRAVQDSFDRHGDLTLNLLGCLSRQLRDDHDLNVRDVGIGFDGQGQIGSDAVGGDARGHHEHGQTPSHTHFDQLSQHGGGLAYSNWSAEPSSNRAPRTTTFSPGDNPDTIWTRP